MLAVVVAVCMAVVQLQEQVDQVAVEQVTLKASQQQAAQPTQVQVVAVQALEEFRERVVQD
jgi:hypothetical protein